MILPEVQRQLHWGFSKARGDLLTFDLWNSSANTAVGVSEPRATPATVEGRCFSNADIKLSNPNMKVIVLQVEFVFDELE